MSLQLASAHAYNLARGYDARCGRIIQREIGSGVSGSLDRDDARAIYEWQRSHAPLLVADGKLGPNSLGVMIEELRARGATGEAAALSAYSHNLPGASSDPVAHFRAIAVEKCAIHKVGSGFRAGGQFRVRIRFKPGVDCERYEYRQYIKGQAFAQQGSFSGTPSFASWTSTGTKDNQASSFAIPGGLKTTFHEDGHVSGGKTERFGYRRSPPVRRTGIEDRYLPSQRAGGEYRLLDTYGLRKTSGRPRGLRIWLKLTYQGRIIDVKDKNRTIRTLHWGFQLDDIIV